MVIIDLLFIFRLCYNYERRNRKALLPELPESCFSFGAAFFSLQSTTMWMHCTLSFHYKVSYSCKMHRQDTFFSRPSTIDTLSSIFYAYVTTMKHPWSLKKMCPIPLVRSVRMSYIERLLKSIRWKRRLFDSSYGLHLSLSPLSPDSWYFSGLPSSHSGLCQ